MEESFKEALEKGYVLEISSPRNNAYIMKFIRNGEVDQETRIDECSYRNFLKILKEQIRSLL